MLATTEDWEDHVTTRKQNFVNKHLTQTSIMMKDCHVYGKCNTNLFNRTFNTFDLGNDAAGTKCWKKQREKEENEQKSKLKAQGEHHKVGYMPPLRDKGEKLRVVNMNAKALCHIHVLFPLPTKNNSINIKRLSLP